jgi:MPBQ/MSBQ methyltransferase
MRLVQHKKEAYWFYKFLSVFYDKLVNPLFWTKKMRDECQELADFNSQDLKVIDVGSGTGFNTEGIIRKVKAANITCVDQSPHQMAKAKKKFSLQECTFIIGDAEQLPVESNQFDRYISAGSIEYWPNPQQGIKEAMRVIKPGGTALIIGPLEPKGWLTRLMATIWMLFPKDEEYREWMKQTGFIDIKVKYTSPHWVSKNVKYGIAIAGKKPQGILESGIEHPDPQEEKETKGFFRSLLLIWRVIIGSLAGFLFIPIALLGYLFSIGKQRNIAPEYREKLNIYQVIALIIILGSLTALTWWIIE